MIKTWTLKLIILLAIIYPLYIVWNINEDFHKTILQSKEVEAIDLVSHMIHNMDQSKHIGHNHTENKNIHLVHKKEDIDGFKLTDSKFHDILNHNTSDLRISNVALVDMNGDVIYNVNGNSHDSFKKSKQFHRAIKEQRAITKMVHGSNLPYFSFFEGHDVSDETHHGSAESIVETYVPILYKDDNTSKVEATGLIEITFDISIMNDDFRSITIKSILILLGPIFIIMIMIYYSFERRNSYSILEKKNQALAESEEKFRLVTQSTHDAIVGIDELGQVIFWNPGAATIFGYKEEEIMGGSFLSLLPEAYIGGYSQVCDKAISVSDSFFVVDDKDIELYGQRMDGTEFPMQVTLTIWPFEKKKIYSAIIKDITERKKFQNKLLYQANYDKLTGLPNRNLIDDRIKQAEITARRNNTKAAIMFIDLDRFKYVNDTFGHDAGDDLLKQVSERLLSCVREADTVARLGGDEFLVILSDVKKPISVRLIANKILGQLSSKFIIGCKKVCQEVNISCSVGIAFYPDDGTSKDDLLKKADAAMYQAKSAGKNNYKFYTSELDSENNTKLQIEKELRTALENNEFYMNYQPIMCMKDETIAGVETLLRWKNPTLGTVPPDVFIPIVEEIGMMPDLGDWIFKTSCSEMNSIVNDESELYLSINVSVAQLENPNFPKLINNIIKETGFPSELIQLEITETMMMKNIEKSIEIMTKLTNTGVTVAIDDFGTGYSSLSYLKKIKASTLKIDKSFINDVPIDEEDVAIVRAITRMSQSLNLKIVAEGIENKEQAEFLKALKCDRGQGYLYYKPMLISELEKIIK